MKKWNKVIVAMMIMAITSAMPAVAGNKHHNDRKVKVVVVDNQKKKKIVKKAVVDRKASRAVMHKKNVNRPDMKACTFKVSRHAVRHNAVAKAERIDGVRNAYWNPRTQEMTVSYDARVTTARHIIRTVA